MPFIALVHPYRLLSHLNLDVVAGALAVNMAAARLAGLPLRFGAEQIALGLAVWSIYMLDRLGDAWRLSAGGIPGKPSHRFALRHWQILLGVTILALGAGAIAAMDVSPLVRQAIGWPGMLAVVSYLGAVQLTSRLRLPFIKEPWVAIIYTLGVVGPPALSAPGKAVLMLAAAAVIVNLAMANLLVIAQSERLDDRAEGTTSLALALGPVWTQRLALVSGLLALLVSVGMLVRKGWLTFFGCGVVASIGLLALVIYVGARPLGGVMEPVRPWADAAFLLFWVGALLG